MFSGESATALPGKATKSAHNELTPLVHAPLSSSRPKRTFRAAIVTVWFALWNCHPEASTGGFYAGDASSSKRRKNPGSPSIFRWGEGNRGLSPIVSNVRHHFMHRLVVCLFMSCAAHSAACAADSPFAGFKCKHDGNQQEMNACAFDDFKSSDKELNTTYVRVMAALSPPKQHQLRQQQRAWLKRRDPQCKDKARESEGGSIWPLEYYGCLRTVTAKRTKEIKAWSPNK